MFCSRPLMYSRACLHLKRLPTHAPTPLWHHIKVKLSSSASELTCWKCGRTIPIPDQVQFFCLCPERVVLPPTSTNFYKVMNCPVSYDVDLTTLKDTYKNLQRQLHPDKFSIKSQEEKKFSAEQSSLVNKAYFTLVSPYSRGIYLLKLNGLTIDEKDNTAGSDLDFLEEVMTLNEELQQLQNELSTEKLRSLKGSNQKKLTELSEQLDMQFKQDDVSAAKVTLARMKYFVNIDEQIRNLLPLDHL